MNGNALGVLSTVALAPLAGSNGVGDVRLEVAYMQAHGSYSGLNFGLVTLVQGTESFNGGQLPAG